MSAKFLFPGRVAGQVPAATQTTPTIVFISVALFLLTILVYLRALNCAFVDWDDPSYVTQNRAVAAGLSQGSIRYAFTTYDTGNWIPLTWLSLECDAALFGLDPRGFHATNVFFHACNVSLLFLTLNSLTRAVGLSAIVALLFGVHPLHVESVAWVSERKDVLSTFWMLLAILTYERYARRPSIGRMAATTLLMALGLLAKPMLVTLPALLLLVDFWPLQRIVWSASQIPREPANSHPVRLWWQVCLEKTPLFALSLIAGTITLAAQRVSMTRESTVPLMYRLGNAVLACGWYLWKTIAPTGLCAFYPHPSYALSWQVVGVSALALAAITVFVAGFGKVRPYLIFGWLWFVLALLPVLGILQVGMQACADRYTYVPHIGLFVLLVWGIDDYLKKIAAGARYGVLLTLGGGLLCIWLTRAQIMTWSDTKTLWSHALAVSQTNYIARRGMGFLLLQEREFDSAEQEFLAALDSFPGDFHSIYALGQISYERQEWDRAAQFFAWTLRIDPQHSSASQGLRDVAKQLPAQPDPIGKSSARARRDPAALEEVRIGLKYARRQFATKADFEVALRHFEEAIRIDPSYPGARNNAAIACQELGRRADAIRHWRAVLVLEPDLPEHHTDLAEALELDGQLSEAKGHYAAALQIKPNDVETQIRLARLLKALSARTD